MAGVADDGDLHFRIIWFLLDFALFVRVHRDLEASTEGSILLVVSHITVLQARSHWVHIEEGVLPVLNVGHGLAVHRHVVLVPDRWQVKVSALLLNLDSLEPIRVETTQG